jgi:putative endonuclease
MNGDKTSREKLRLLYFWYLYYLKKKIPKDSKLRGEYGEWLAERYLLKKSYTCLHRNWRSKQDRRMELDLVCLQDNHLVFVEVRARSSNAMVNGWQSLSPRKRKALLTSSKHYLQEEKRFFESYRFDLVEIDIPENSFTEFRLFHHENIAIYKR